METNFFLPDLSGPDFLFIYVIYSIILALIFKGYQLTKLKKESLHIQDELGFLEFTILNGAKKNNIRQNILKNFIFSLLFKKNIKIDSTDGKVKKLKKPDSKAGNLTDTIELEIYNSISGKIILSQLEKNFSKKLNNLIPVSYTHLRRRRWGSLEEGTRH